MFNSNWQSLQGTSCQPPLKRLQCESETEGISVEMKIKNLVDKTNRANHILDVVVPTCDGHDLGEQDKVVCGGGEDTKAKENGEEQPLSDVTQNVPRRVLGVIVRLGPPTVSLQLLQSCNKSHNMQELPRSRKSELVVRNFDDSHHHIMFGEETLVFGTVK